MDYDDYAELRRRAERRLTVMSVWPLVLAQAAGYLLMMIRNPLVLIIPLLAFLGAAGVSGLTYFVYRRRTAANCKVRRDAIDETLEDAVDAGWPIEEPTARDLRLLATLLDDDMETRAGMGRVVVWGSLAAVLIWVLTYVYAGGLIYRDAWASLQIEYMFIFTAWLLVLGGFTFLHQRQRRLSEARVGTALRRASGQFTGKPKRAVEAPWWNEDYDEDKPKRILLEEEEILSVDDDGELMDDFDAIRRRKRLG